MTNRKTGFGLDGSREFRRSQRHKECTAKGFHTRSAKTEVKTLGGQPFLMELCGYCDVWVEQSRLDWQ